MSIKSDINKLIEKNGSDNSSTARVLEPIGDRNSFGPSFGETSIPAVVDPGLSGGIRSPVVIDVQTYEEIEIEIPEGATTYTFRRTKTFVQTDADGREINATVNYPD